MLTGIGIHVRGTDSLYILQRAVTGAVVDGDLHPRDIGLEG
jgi:hypothetical protein